jgi:hypothetical protein
MIKANKTVKKYELPSAVVENKKPEKNSAAKVAKFFIHCRGLAVLSSKNNTESCILIILGLDFGINK